MRLPQLTRSYQVFNGGSLWSIFGGIGQSSTGTRPLQVLTYGPLIAINAQRGEQCVVTITDAVAFTISAPTHNPAAGSTQHLYLTVRNASGGAHGAGTWDPIFLTSGAFPTIANTFSRTFAFFWNGANYVEMFETYADVTN